MSNSGGQSRNVAPTIVDFVENRANMLWANHQMAWTILTHPEATVGQKALAAAYIDVELIAISAGAAGTIGLGAAGWQATGQWIGSVCIARSELCARVLTGSSTASSRPEGVSEEAERGATPLLQNAQSGQQASPGANWPRPPQNPQANWHNLATDESLRLHLKPHNLPPHPVPTPHVDYHGPPGKFWTWLENSALVWREKP